MKTNLSNLDFWDEPLPVHALRRLQRNSPASRQLLLAPSRKPVLRTRMHAMALARNLRRASRR